MKIDKVFNNNVVATITDDGKEAIVTGPGVGFQKKSGDLVDEGKITKSYFMQNVRKNKLYQLLERTSIEYLEIAEAILKKARQDLQKEVNDSVLIALTDHIAFSVERSNEGMVLPNLILNETKAMYPEEFKIGTWAIYLINELLNVKLSDGEAGYIAIHIINATAQNKNTDAVQIVEFVQNVLESIKRTFAISLNEESLDYTRLITHLKFFAHRIVKKEQKEIDGFHEMYELLEKRDPRMQTCIRNIQVIAKEEFNYDINTNEMVYLIIHILKVIH